MDTAPYMDIGQFPLHDAFNPDSSTIFDPSLNSTLDSIVSRILPVAYPPHTVSSLTDYTLGPNPVYKVTITSEPHPVKLFCNSRDSMYVMVPLVDNPRVQALATMSNSASFLTEFLTHTEHFPHHTQECLLSSGPPGTNAPYFRALYRSTGTGPGTKHLVFSAYYKTQILTFLEVGGGGAGGGGGGGGEAVDGGELRRGAGVEQRERACEDPEGEPGACAALV
jgi:hypothetical protein